MRFTQSCFIRKNSKELQNELKKMGYETNSIITDTGCIATSSIIGAFIVINEWQWDSADPRITWNNKDRLDCGDNEDLFLAIAAMNDENDYMQWFVCDDGVSMFRIDQKGFSADKFVHEYMDGWDTTGYRKATVKELIEEFG